jgi:hypothetical protein
VVEAAVLLGAVEVVVVVVAEARDLNCTCLEDCEV